MEDILYKFGAILLSSDVEMPDWIDIHDKYGIYIDSIDVYKIEVSEKEVDVKSSLLIES